MPVFNGEDRLQVDLGIGICQCLSYLIYNQACYQITGLDFIKKNAIP